MTDTALEGTMPTDKDRLAVLLNLLDKVNETSDYDNDRSTVIVDMEAWNTLIDYVTNEFEESDYESENESTPGRER